MLKKERQGYISILRGAFKIIQSDPTLNGGLFLIPSLLIDHPASTLHTHNSCGGELTTPPAKDQPLKSPTSSAPDGIQAVNCLLRRSHFTVSKAMDGLSARGRHLKNDPAAGSDTYSR